MKNFGTIGAALVALVALYMGGCSLRWIWRSGVWECWFTDRYPDCGIENIVAIIAVSVLIAAIFLGWFAWRTFKKSVKKDSQPPEGKP